MAITKEGESQDFNYTGNVQSFTVPVDGIYKLEVWGAQGGNVYSGPYSGEIKATASGGAGGYSVGYTVLEKDEIIYICVGSYPEGWNNCSGGYNGGGSGSEADGAYWNASGGGGATHIAKTNRGVLSSYDSYRSEVLLVAGGGGGAQIRSNDDDTFTRHYGGSGGGLNGGAGSDGNAGGSQTGGYAFGKGASGWGAYMSGSGGGWFGGTNPGQWNSGSGGSGYIDGTPALTYKGVTYSPSTSNGARSGNGLARITLIKKAMPATLYLGGLELTGIFVGDKEIKSAFLGDKDLG